MPIGSVRPLRPSPLGATLLALTLATPAALSAQLPTIEAFTRGMVSRDGFVPVHMDPATGKAFLEVGVLDTDVLYPALERVLDVLSPEALAVPPTVQALVSPPPPGFQEPPAWVDPAVGVAVPPAVGSHATWIESPAGPVLDPPAVARSYAQEVVDNLLHRERMARVVSFHAMDPAQPSLDEVLARLVEGTLGAAGLRSGAAGAYRRAAGSGWP